MGDNNGKEKTAGGSIGFPEGFRRRVCGETIEKGDLCCDCATSSSWRPAEPGHVVRGHDTISYACPETIPVAQGVAERMLARFQLFVIENLYAIENIATADRSARYCRCCGAEGDFDMEGLYAIVGSMHRSGKLATDEFESVNDAENEDEALKAYEDLVARYSRRGHALPAIPLCYEHTGECDAMMLTRVIGDFAEVFGAYVTSRRGDLHEVADFFDDSFFL
jgi:hypothetical protein